MKLIHSQRIISFSNQSEILKTSRFTMAREKIKLAKYVSNKDILSFDLMCLIGLYLNLLLLILSKCSSCHINDCLLLDI